MRCPNDEIAQFLEEYAHAFILADETAAAMAAIDWQGYFPVIDGDFDLTGDWRYADADMVDYYLVPYTDAVILCGVADPQGWMIDTEEGTAEPRHSTAKRMLDKFCLTDSRPTKQTTPSEETT